MYFVWDFTLRNLREYTVIKSHVRLIITLHEVEYLQHSRFVGYSKDDSLSKLMENITYDVLQKIFVEITNSCVAVSKFY